MNRDEAEGSADPEILAERLRSALERIEANAEASEQARNLLRQATSRFMDEQARIFGEFREEMTAALDAVRDEQLRRVDELAGEHRALSERQHAAEARLTRELAELRASIEGGDARA